MVIAVVWAFSVLFLIARASWAVGKWLVRRARRSPDGDLASWTAAPAVVSAPMSWPSVPAPSLTWALPPAERQAAELAEVVNWCVWAMSTDMHPDAVVRAIRHTDPNWWATTARFMAHVDSISTTATELELAGWCMHVGDINRGRQSQRAAR